MLIIEIFCAFFRNIAIDNALNAVTGIKLIETYFNIKTFSNTANTGAQSIEREEFIEIFKYNKKNLEI